MSKRVLSAKEVIKVLCREFGFYFVSQKGSHIKLRKKVKNKLKLLPQNKWTKILSEIADFVTERQK